MVSAPRVQAIGVSKSFVDGTRKRTLLRDVNLEAHNGEMVAIMGPSGCGKSTLLKLFSGLARPDSGTLEIDGLRLDSMPAKSLHKIRCGPVSLISQDYRLLERESILANVALPLTYGRNKVRRQERRNMAEEALLRANLSVPLKSSVQHLSGGERQRVAIARALVRDPAVLLADEPTSALDHATGRAVTDTLRATAERGTLILIATHDLQVAEQCDRTLRFVEDGYLVG